MLSLLAPPRPHRTTARRRLGRALPAFALGLAALAVSVPGALTAAAAPVAPATSQARPHTTKPPVVAQPASTRQAAVHRAKPGHLTKAARRAGLEPGNATMGWRSRGTERVLPVARPASTARSATARSTAPAFVPQGVLGIDVSSYQGKVRWSTWTGRDKRFAYVKATEGTSYRNPSFAAQYQGAAKAGMTRGAYHFASPSGKAGYQQARYFVAHGGGWSADGRTLPGVLDIEYNPYGSTCYGLSRKKMVRWISSFTVEYKRLTGKDAVIYTTTDWWKRCTGNSAVFGTTNPLWIARYGTQKPGTLPAGWAKATFWQYSANPIDQDVFQNTPKRLKVLATKI